MGDLKKEYYLGISDVTDVKSFCLADSDGYILSSKVFVKDDEAFYKEVERLSEMFNAIELKESDKPSQSVKMVGKIPHINKAMADYLKTDKGRGELKKWLFEEDKIDYALVEELKNFANKNR